MGIVISYIHNECEALEASKKLGTNTNNEDETDIEAKTEEDNDGEEKNNTTEDGLDHSPDHPESGNDSDSENEEKRTTTLGNRDNDRDKNISGLTRVRDSFLDLLVERTHDVSPYTRANVLKVNLHMIQ